MRSASRWAASARAASSRRCSCSAAASGPMSAVRGRVIAGFGAGGAGAVGGAGAGAGAAGGVASITGAGAGTDIDAGFSVSLPFGVAARAGVEGCRSGVAWGVAAGAGGVGWAGASEIRKSLAASRRSSQGKCRPGRPKASPPSVRLNSSACAIREIAIARCRRLGPGGVKGMALKFRGALVETWRY